MVCYNFTAAHCFQNKLSPKTLSHNEVTAFVGKHNLNVSDEPGSVEHSVQEIVLHHDWDYQSPVFDADISILVLRDPVVITRNVEPICLPRPSYDEVVGTGTVVGWGVSEHSEAAGEQHDWTPNELEAPAVSQSHCVFTVRKLFAISSLRTFCAGFVGESKSVCSGDSGGGFYLRDLLTNNFNLRGIVSSAAYDPDQLTRGCDVNVYSIYTNVARFIDWIRNEMEKSKEVKWKEVEFDCVTWNNHE
jgi:secreted trypsin-like serine protease